MFLDYLIEVVLPTLNVGGARVPVKGESTEHRHVHACVHA